MKLRALLIVPCVWLLMCVVATPAEAQLAAAGRPASDSKHR